MGHKIARTIDNGPEWATWLDIPAVILHPPHFRKTTSIALVVGSILFVINQLDIVLTAGATLTVAVKVGLTYLVPFFTSNYGLLVARRRQARKSIDS